MRISARPDRKSGGRRVGCGPTACGARPQNHLHRAPGQDRRRAVSAGRHQPRMVGQPRLFHPRRICRRRLGFRRHHRHLRPGHRARQGTLEPQRQAIVRGFILSPRPERALCCSMMFMVDAHLPPSLRAVFKAAGHVAIHRLEEMKRLSRCRRTKSEFNFLSFLLSA